MKRSIKNALKNYPMPEVDPAVLKRAMAIALKRQLVFWPLAFGALGLVLAFGVALDQVLAAQTTEFVYSSSLAGFLFQMGMVVATSLFQLITQYGDLMIGVSTFAIALELFVNRKQIFHAHVRS